MKWHFPFRQRIVLCNKSEYLGRKSDINVGFHSKKKISYRDITTKKLKVKDIFWRVNILDRKACGQEVGIYFTPGRPYLITQYWTPTHGIYCSNPRLDMISRKYCRRFTVQETAGIWRRTKGNKDVEVASTR